MSNLLTHAVVAGACACALSSVASLSSATTAVFAACMTALILGLDRYETAEGLRSPVGHSLFMGWVWTCVVCVSCWTLGLAFRSAPWVACAIGSSLGIWSHLTLDALSMEGIYTIP
ncbi:MAG: hypothetical protein AB1665_08745, partial [Candidatus Thermoplasmatota archaeon]